MTQDEHDFECIALRGQCPDCNAVKLQVNGQLIYCKGCHASFYAGEFYVRRVKLADDILPSGEVILLQKAQ